MPGPVALGFREHQPRIHQMDFGKGGEKTPTDEKTLIGVVQKTDVGTQRDGVTV